MKSTWLATYENVEIKVMNSWFHGEKMLVNGEVQDERFGAFSSNLTGHLIDSKGERKNIKANLGGSFSIHCNIFVDDKKMEVNKI
ncbi:hypothetical protein SAMN05444411_10632 [Lutibacter oricola]|uniref:Uncharacterized protein n=1 Tax=Lutibacter oricola TaxID=762486 RepID=A0A1H3C2P6_9FLAO|nr:hypothetical protein [Lutibacter oricola]SDX48442.1 hypothetical protein SAMN05444411_10632 [Lutibacter oricola]